MGKGNCAVTKTAYTLMIIGAINWGLVGVGGFAGGDWNVVKMLLGQWPTVEWIVYILVGLAGIWSIFKCCSCCSKGEGKM